MKSIGGYYDLELQAGEHYHKNGIRINTSRNGLEYILRTKKYKKVYIPYFTCEVMLEPFVKCNIQYEYYSINELLEPVRNYELASDEAFLYTNYFGVKDEAVLKVADIYRERLIIDNAQAFYAKPIDKVDCIFSARKFFGVSDGGYVYTDGILNEEPEQDLSFERMSHLLKRIDVSAESAYSEFVENDDSLIGEPIKKMSKLTERILNGIDYDSVKNKRLKNFLFLHSRLKNDNQLNLSLTDNSVPMVYPFRMKDKSLRERLIKNKIYVATFWPNIFRWCNDSQLEYALAKEIIPIPVDQRYDETDMTRILNFI